MVEELIFPFYPEYNKNNEELYNNLITFLFHHYKKHNSAILISAEGLYSKIFNKRDMSEDLEKETKLNIIKFIEAKCGLLNPYKKFQIMVRQNEAVNGRWENFELDSTRSLNNFRRLISQRILMENIVYIYQISHDEDLKYFILSELKTLCHNRYNSLKNMMYYSFTVAGKNLLHDSSAIRYTYYASTKSIKNSLYTLVVDKSPDAKDCLLIKIDSDEEFIVSKYELLEVIFLSDTDLPKLIIDNENLSSDNEILFPTAPTSVTHNILNYFAPKIHFGCSHEVFSAKKIVKNMFIYCTDIAPDKSIYFSERIKKYLKVLSTEHSYKTNYILMAHYVVNNYENNFDKVVKILDLSDDTTFAMVTSCFAYIKAFFPDHFLNFFLKLNADLYPKLLCIGASICELSDYQFFISDNQRANSIIKTRIEQ